MTHFEDLRSNSSGNSSDKTTQESDVIENMLDSISLTSKLESEKNLAGLVECYKKICKVSGQLGRDGSIGEDLGATV